MSLFADINGFSKEAVKKPERKEKVDYSEVDYCGKDFEDNLFNNEIKEDNFSFDTFNSEQDIDIDEEE